MMKKDNDDVEERRVKDEDFIEKMMNIMKSR
jgi:hypothetical protein